MTENSGVRPMEDPQRRLELAVIDKHFQRLAPGAVAVPIVDVLQSIQIEEQQSDRLPIPSPAFELCPQPRRTAAGIEEACERVPPFAFVGLFFATRRDRWPAPSSHGEATQTPAIPLPDGYPVGQRAHPRTRLPPSMRT